MSYSDSHLERGTTYDQVLRESPFDAYMARWEAKYAIETVRRHFPQGVPRYLDFACGTARITQLIAPLARETVGVDVSPSMLREATAKVPGVRFIQADLTKEDAKVGLFDLVSSFRFLGNAEQSLRLAVLRALNGVLRDGAYLLVNSHRNPLALASLLNSATGGERVMDLTFGKLRSLLSTTGFEIVERRPIAFWQYRSKIMNTVSSDPDREARLERQFGSSALVPFAPDALILARKVRPVAMPG